MISSEAFYTVLGVPAVITGTIVSAAFVSAASLDGHAGVLLGLGALAWGSGLLLATHVTWPSRARRPRTGITDTAAAAATVAVATDALVCGMPLSPRRCGCDEKAPHIPQPR